MQRVVYTSASAMAVFKEATEVFMTRLPASAFKDNSPRATVLTTPEKPSFSSGNKTYCGPATPPTSKKFTSPKFGCYLCEKTDHYCSDRAFHPLNADGKHAPVSPATRKLILARIDKSDLSAELKAAEKSKVKDFWLRRCAP